MEFKYRADIDGLRAIAVLAVLFFHTDVPGFSGGFVGVDVFFVISGYLITSIILKEIKAENFSIARFYERRIRRIFPALFPVIAFVLVAGAYLFDANAFKGLGQSIAATTLFSSNILFWREAGYFDAPSLQKPLLHTWSLAVEEQFYIFFPLTLMAIHRYLKGKYFLWVVIAFIISLAASVYGVIHNPGATFYLVPTRAWELMVGSILALGVLPDLSTDWQRNVFTLTGLALILFSIFAYTEATPFPGLAALAPVVGSGLIIYSGRKGTHQAQKLFTAKPLLFIGLISYSLYLWHWPLVAFTKYLLFRPFTGIDSAAIIVASLLIASFSWKFIEQPFRGKQMLLSERRRLFALAGVVMFFAVGIGGVIHLQNGMSWRYGLSITKYNGNNNGDNVPPISMIGKKESVPSFVVWGDSHADALIPAFDSSAKKYGISGYSFSHGSTPALLGIESNLDDSDFSKAKWNRDVLAFINKNKNIRVVFLAGSWKGYNVISYKNLRFKDIYNEVFDDHFHDGYEYVNKGLSRTIDALIGSGKKVIIIADTPRFSYSVPRVFMVQNRCFFIGKITDFVPKIRAQNHEQREILFKFIGKPGVKIIYPANALADNDGYCKLVSDGQLLFADSNHLSVAGALYVAPVFEPLFKEMARNQSAGQKVSAN